MTGPTPTPWRVRATSRSRMELELVCGDAVIGWVEDSPAIDGQHEANAALIVKAVNAYQPMLEALDALTQFTDSTCAFVDADPLLANARAAIALAKGEQS